MVVLALVASALFASGAAQYQCPVCKKNPNLSGADECQSCRAARLEKEAADAAREFEPRLDRLICATAGQSAGLYVFQAFWHLEKDAAAVGVRGFSGGPFDYYPSSDRYDLWKMGLAAVAGDKLVLIRCGSAVANDFSSERLSAD